MLFEVLERRSLLAAAAGQILKDINPWDGSSLSIGQNKSVSFKGKTYFAATTDINGRELWSSDGTDAGTALVADLAANNQSSNPRDFLVVGGKLYFVADWASTRYYQPTQAKVFVTDGTTAGTHVVENGPENYNFDLYGALAEPAGEPTLVAFNGKVAFVAAGARYGYVDNPNVKFIWVTDGTAAGTSYKDSYYASYDTQFTHLTTVGTNLFFVKHDPYQGDRIARLGSADSIATDVTALYNNDGAVQQMVAVGTSIYFRTDAPTDYAGQLWRIDSAGQISRAYGSNLQINNLLVANGQLILAAGYAGFNTTTPAPSDNFYGVSEQYLSLYVTPLSYNISGIRPTDTTVIGNRIYFTDTNSFYGTSPACFDLATNQLTEFYGAIGEAFTSVSAATTDGPAYVQGPDGRVYFQASTASYSDTLFRVNAPAGVAERYLIPAYGIDLDLRPSGLMAIGNNWYAPGTGTYDGREWRLIQQPMGSIQGWIYEGSPSPSYPLDAASGVTPYLDTNNNGQLDAGEPSAAIGYGGTFVFSNLLDGVYRLRLAVPVGTQFISPNTSATQLITVQEDAQVTAGIIAVRVPKTLSITLFNDANYDGTRNAGEAALPGRTVYADANSNFQLDAGEVSAISGSDGVAALNLFDGTYTIRQILPAGWQPSTSDVFVQVFPNMANKVFAMGSRQLPIYDATIIGYAYNDTNGNGVRDVAETALVGRTIFVDANLNGTLDAGERSIVTSSTGSYGFNGFAAGTYMIRQVLPAGWQQTAPAPSVGQIITVTGPNYFNNRDFGSRLTPVTPTDPASVKIEAETATFTGGSAKGSSNSGYTGTGYADFGGLNSAAEWAVSRNAAGQVSIDVRYANGGAADRPLTLLVNGVAVGTLAFATTGNWTTWKTTSITATLKAGANSIKLVAAASIGGGNVDSVTINTGSTPPPPPPATGSISGFTFDDTDKDGVYDATETKTTGKTVFIDLDGDGVLDTNEQRITTATGGGWSFTALPAGAYSVRQVFASGTEISTPLINVTLTAGQIVSGLTIGTKAITVTPPPPPGTASIAGTAFNDNNSNAKYDAGDGIGKAVTMFLDADNDGVLDSNEKSVITDTSGKFIFTGLAAGTYRVRRIFAAGQTYSTPLANITLTAGQAKTGVLVGAKKS